MCQVWLEISKNHFMFADSRVWGGVVKSSAASSPTLLLSDLLQDGNQLSSLDTVWQSVDGLLYSHQTGLLLLRSPQGHIGMDCRRFLVVMV